MAELASDDAETAGGVALRVHIHDEPAQAELRKVGRHVDGGGSLPDSALLVDDCVDSWQFAGWNAGRLLPGLYGGPSQTHVCLFRDEREEATSHHRFWRGESSPSRSTV